MTRAWTVLCLVLLLGCGASTRVVRPETGTGGEPLVLTLRPGDSRPLEVDEDEVRRAVALLGRQVKPSAQPLEDAQRWLGVPPRAEALRYDGRDHRVFPEAEGSALVLEQDEALCKAYLRWCARVLGAGDCLGILKGGWRLDAEGRYVLAMAIAYGSVLGETKEAFGEMVDPVAVMATVVSGGTVYMMLWVLPEPISKGLAGAMTVVLVGYLGVDTVWGIIGGWKDLVDAVDGATTFEEIRAAGEQYSQVLGERAARLFIMVGTAAVGNTAAQFSSKLPKLPELQQLALGVKGSVHVRLGALAQVESVAISAEGLVVALAPGVMAMAESGLSRWQQGSGGGWLPPREGPGEWVKDTASMSDAARRYQAQVTGAPQGFAYRVTRDGKEVEFDGFEDGVLLEAKAEGYAQFINDKMAPKEFFRGAAKLLDQADRQLEAANGIPVRWIVAEKKLAGMLRKLFKDTGRNIEVVHIEPKPAP